MTKHMKSGLYSPGKVALRADYAFNHPDTVKRFEAMGAEVCPVDMNAGLVTSKVGKWGMDNATGECTQENIRERFGLATPDGDKSC